MRRLISSGSTFEAEIGFSRAVVDGDWVRPANDTTWQWQLSGTIDTRRGTLEGKLSGEIDLARWIAAGAPGAKQAGGVVRGGGAGCHDRSGNGLRAQ